jgi:hypothetical protein
MNRTQVCLKINCYLHRSTDEFTFQIIGSTGVQILIWQSFWQITPTQFTGVQNLSVGSTDDKKNCGVHMSYFSLAGSRLTLSHSCLARLFASAVTAAVVRRLAPPTRAAARRPRRLAPHHHSRAFALAARASPRAAVTPPPSRRRRFPPHAQPRPCTTSTAARALPPSRLRPSAAHAPSPPPQCRPRSTVPSLHLHRAAAHAHCIALAHSRPYSPLRFLDSVVCRDGS